MITIRPATMADLDGLTALLQILFAIEADFAGDEARQRRGLAMLLASPSAAIMVAEAGGQVIGMATGQTTISTAEGGFALLVEDVVVEAAWRGQGLGWADRAPRQPRAARTGRRRDPLAGDGRHSARLLRAAGRQRRREPETGPGRPRHQRPHHRGRDRRRRGPALRRRQKEAIGWQQSAKKAKVGMASSATSRLNALLRRLSP